MCGCGTGHSSIPTSLKRAIIYQPFIESGFGFAVNCMRQSFRLTTVSKPLVALPTPPSTIPARPGITPASRMRYGIRSKAAPTDRRHKMVRLLYCWRCQMEMPMLEEHEADYVLERGPDQEFGPDQNRILRRYFEVTGFEETNANAVWHHMVVQHGVPCSSCGKPLRTPRARMCAACGAQVASQDKNDQR